MDLGGVELSSSMAHTG
jgi:hypothetical protein